jgi:transposase-like protein
MELKLKCPHCEKGHVSIHRVQSCDDLNHITDHDELKELWQCDDCAKYFLVIYEVRQITKLMEQLAP